MAFDNSALVKIGGQNQAQCVYTYSSDDLQSEVLSSGYFNAALGRLRQYDYIYVRNGVEDYYIGVNSESLPITTVFFNTMQANGVTGWSDYVDTQYTEASPFQLIGDVVTNIPNNKGTVIESQKPLDVDTFYDGTVITGRDGDGLTITIDFIAKPREVAATGIELYIDITGGTGTPARLSRLYRRLRTFDKGVNIEKPINYTVTGYTLNTWQANGGVLKAISNGNCDIYDIRYVLTRTHKAR